MIFIMNFIKRLFKQKTKTLTLVCFFRGKSYQIEAEYEAFLKRDVEIVSTAITKDFTKYGKEESFVLIVTYKNKRN